jgi:glycosyltransferase involved in cell wall biosynthesis
MRILHVINNLGSGGAERLVAESLPLMKAYPGVEVELLLLTEANSVFLEGLKKEGIKVTSLNSGKNIYSIYNPLNILKIAKEITKKSYDIVHVHLFPAQYWVALAKIFIKSRDFKLLTTEHSTNNRRRGKFYFRPIDRFIYSLYDCIISISPSTQENLLIWLKPATEESKKYRIIENGINLDNFCNAIPYDKRELSQFITNETRTICMVGRFTEAKDHATLIQAMQRLPEHVHLLLVGEGPLRQEKEKLVVEMGLGKRVHFLGFRRDVERIIKTADVVVLSSNWEGFGLSAVEGMAAGKPVIASRVPGLKDVVEDEELLFEVGNEQELAEKISWLLNDERAYAEKAGEARKRSKKYDIKNMVDRYMETYFELCGVKIYKR